jgi:hypothetical protein
MRARPRGGTPHVFVCRGNKGVTGERLVSRRNKGVKWQKEGEKGAKSESDAKEVANRRNLGNGRGSVETEWCLRFTTEYSGDAVTLSIDY